MKSEVSNELKRFNYLFRETGAVYYALSSKFGIPQSVMEILYVVLEEGGACSIREICNYSGMTKQTVNSALRRLEAENIVYLKKSDGKNKNVVFTESGRQLAVQTAGHVIKMENDIFESWPKAEVEKYLEMAERYLKDLRQLVENMDDAAAKERQKL